MSGAPGSQPSVSPVRHSREDVFRRFARRALWVVTGIIAIVLAIYAASRPLLTTIGDQLVHSDPLERVDAMIILASALDRIIEGAGLYKEGFAPVVILTREQPDPSEAFLRSRGIAVESSEDRRRRVLQALGVPSAAIVVLGGAVESTADEARGFARWAAGRPIRSVLIVTSPFHTARARLTFLRVLEEAQIKVLVRPSKLARFHSSTWWQSRDTLREGFYEWQKLVYYRLFELRNIEPVAPAPSW